MRRLVGSSPTGHDILSAIEKVIADFFQEYDNVMIFYYCDFINPIPHTKKTSMPPQEYRSNLFRLMFERYVSLHDIDDVHLSVITAKGIDDTYYFHLIYRECHAGTGLTEVQLANQVCYLVDSEAGSNGKTKITQIGDLVISALLSDRKDLLDKYNAAGDKRTRQSALNVLSILREAALLE